MLRAGLLPPPVVIPLSSNLLSLKNKIDTETFIELRSDVPNVRIYFTVDGTKPDPFQKIRTEYISTYLYRGAFRLEPGKRVIKAITITNNGLCESNVITKYFNVNDIHTENFHDRSNEYSYNNQSSIDYNQSKNNSYRSEWNNKSTSPIIYANTQINIWNTPRENLIDSNEYMKEQMIEHLRSRKTLTSSARNLNIKYDEENFWNQKMKPFSFGNGNWKKTLEHLFLNIYNYVKNQDELQEIFSWKKFGEIEKTHLIDQGRTYQLVTTFKKPLSEQTLHKESLSLPIRKASLKHRPKTRIQKLSNTYEEKPIRRTRSLTPPIHHEESIHEKKQMLRIYTEEIMQQGTLIPFRDFNADRDCENLHKAAKRSLGTDDNMLIDILGNRTNDQRLKIHNKYKTMFSRNLYDDLKTDVSENFRQILKNLLYSSVEYDCYELRRGIKGLGIDEDILIEILSSRSNKRLHEIIELYSKLFNQSLENDITSNTNGHLKRLLIALIQGQRPESNQINENIIENDAKSLYEAGENKWATDESKFIQILCNRSDIQLKYIFEAYRKFSKQDIEKVIKSETSGNLRKGLLAIVRIMRNRPGFFAYQLKKALKGKDTDKDELNRIIISRCEIDMIQIKEEYENIMKHSLDEHIDNNTSGNYRKILLELLKEPNQRIQKVKKEKHENINESDYKQPEIYNEEIIQQGTMIAAKNFDANRDADALRKAMKGLGTDEQTIVNILGNRNTTQRLEIKSSFKNKLGRDLLSDLKSETSGDFLKLLERLMMSPVELDCFELKQAVKGAGTDEEALIEILASRSNERIKSINETYLKMYSKPLEKDVKSDTSGNFRRLLVSLMQGHRPETTKVNMDEIKQDAQLLMNAGSAKFGTDEAIFNNLFCNRSDSQLKGIFNEFSKLTGKTIEETAKKETSGDLQKGILAIIRCIQSRPHFFAEQLRTAMKGLGTKESTLNRIIVTRSEIDLVQIKAAYKHLFNRELERDVSADTSGYYKNLLLEILKDPSQRN